MHLSDLTASMHDVEVVLPGNPAITGLTADSRTVRPGFVFAAMAGVKIDGRQFIRDAVANGAAAILLPKAARAGGDDHREAPGGAFQTVSSGIPPGISPGVPVVTCGNIRLAFGEAVDTFYGHPSLAIELIGITGTNGKTTSAYLLRHILNAAGRKAGMLGTIEYDYGDRREPAPLTTPDAVAFTRGLAEMRDSGCAAAIVEASSHSLAQERTWPHRFAAAIFTNLTRDHLDYHGDMDAYLEAKRRLFLRLDRSAAAVVNYRDSAAPKMVRGCAAKVMPFFLNGRGTGSRPSLDDLYEADILTSDLGGQRFRLRGNGIDTELFTPLVGWHNVENCLGCVLAAVGLGVPLDGIGDALAGFSGVPGRLERLESQSRVKAFVDYAHTDDALRSVLSVLRPLVRGKLITVFGCGGDRDPGKRPLMAKAAESYSDIVVATSDNPRTEDPESILDGVMAGFSGAGRVIREADRPKAVSAAIGMAGPDDAVLVAGKGHEDYQIVGVEKRHMDDRELIRDAFASLGI